MSAATEKFDEEIRQLETLMERHPRVAADRTSLLVARVLVRILEEVELTNGMLYEGKDTET